MHVLNSPTITKATTKATITQEKENIENEPYPGSITTNKNPLKLLTDNTINVICQAIKRGNTKKNACQLAGITPVQFNHLIRPAVKVQKRQEEQYQQALQPLEQKLQALSHLSPETEEDHALLIKEENNLQQQIQQVMEQHYQALQDMAANDVAHRAIQAVALAEASLEDALVDTWYQLRHSDWKAAKDFLARRFPKEWSEAAAQRKAGMLPSQQGTGNNQQVNVNILSQQLANNGANINGNPLLGAGVGVNNNGTNQNGNGNGFGFPYQGNTLTLGYTQNVQQMDLSKLTQEELDHFEKLLAKVPYSANDSDGEMET